MDKGIGKGSMDRSGSSKATPGADSDRADKGGGGRGKGGSKEGGSKEGGSKEGGSKLEKKGKRKKSSVDTGLYTVKKILQRKKAEGPKV